MSVGFTELLVISLIIFIIFGAGKLPNVMGDIGKAIHQFRKGIKEGQEDTSENKK